MTDKSCAYCYFVDFCKQDEVCDYYYPFFAVDEESDEFIDDLIERGRIAFRGEWFNYLDNNED